MLTRIIKKVLEKDSKGRTRIIAHYTDSSEEEEASKLYAEFKDFNSFGTLCIGDKVFNMYVGAVEKEQLIEGEAIFKHKIILIEV